MIGALVVTRQSLADFRRGHPYDRILGRVVPGVTGEDLVADRPLLQRPASVYVRSKPARGSSRAALFESKRGSI